MGVAAHASRSLVCLGLLSVRVVYFWQRSAAGNSPRFGFVFESPQPQKPTNKCKWVDFHLLAGLELPEISATSAFYFEVSQPRNPQINVSRSLLFVSPISGCGGSELPKLWFCIFKPIIAEICKQMQMKPWRFFLCVFLATRCARNLPALGFCV